MNKVKKQFGKLYVILVISLAVVIIGVGTFLALGRFNVVPHLIATVEEGNKKESFPVIDSKTLTAEQQKIVVLLKQEYASQPAGTKYSDGVSEAWCADFVSWIMNNAGYPLDNPNSGSWRIPGTYTLREYYQSVGRFHAANSEYSPKVGDIMLYDNPSPFGQHTNIVVKNDNGLITTIGGNEPGGIRVITHKTKDGIGFIGYGSLE
ncbi:MAG TPA: CHAP domain-containing protein [Candidatus Microsaccharimonas sp.]